MAAKAKGKHERSGPTSPLGMLNRDAMPLVILMARTRSTTRVDCAPCRSKNQAR
jgi:hypothetical protein